MTSFRPFLSGVFLQVSDVDRSRKFYESIGFRFYRNRPDDNSWYAMLGPIELVLHPDFEEYDKERGVGINLILWVEDADSYFAELKDQGVETEQDPEDRPWGREFHFRDPDGYTIEILGPPRT